MDGLSSGGTGAGVPTLAGTSRFEALDPALLRLGCMDALLKVHDAYLCFDCSDRSAAQCLIWHLEALRYVACEQVQGVSFARQKVSGLCKARPFSTAGWPLGKLRRRSMPLLNMRACVVLFRCLCRARRAGWRALRRPPLAADVDLPALAAATAGFSCADLTEVARLAGLAATR